MAETFEARRADDEADAIAAERIRSGAADRTEGGAEALKQRIADLLVECKGNPFLGELMGRGLHPELLANCRRVRFDIPSQSGKPRFCLIHRNKPTDGAPAECRWLTVAPRAGLPCSPKGEKALATR